MKEPSIIVKKGLSLDRSRSRKYELALQLAPDYPHSNFADLYNYLGEQGYYWDSKHSWWAKKGSKRHETTFPNEVKIRMVGHKEMLDQFKRDFDELMRNKGYQHQQGSIGVHPVKGNEDVWVGYVTVVRFG